MRDGRNPAVGFRGEGLVAFDTFDEAVAGQNARDDEGVIAGRPLRRFQVRRTHPFIVVQPAKGGVQFLGAQGTTTRSMNAMP